MLKDYAYYVPPDPKLSVLHHVLYGLAITSASLFVIIVGIFMVQVFAAVWHGA